MKRITLLFTLFIIMTLLATCAGTSTPPPARRTPTPTRTPTPFPTEASTPLVLSNTIYVSPVFGDDTANIQAAFDLLNTGLGNHNPGYMEFEPGVYDIDGTLNLKGKYRIIVNGQGAILQGDFSLNASGSYATLRDLNLHSTSANPAFIYGRDVNGSGGWMVLENVDVFSNNSIGAVLFAQADLSKITDSEIYNGGNAPALILTSENETGLLDYAASTETFVSIRDCYIHGNGDELVSMRGLVQKVLFDTTFFMPNGAAVAVESGQVYNITFLNSGSEGLADAVLMRVDPGAYAGSVATINYTHSVYNAQFVFDIQGEAVNWNVPIIYKSNSNQKIFNVSGKLTDSDIYAYSNDIVSTGQVYNNRISAYGGNPIQGTSGYNRITYNNGLESVNEMEVTSSFSYADADILKLNNANLTHLATQTPNQSVTIVCDHTSTISGGYFIGIPDPFTCNGEVLEFISLAPWYWTLK